MKKCISVIAALAAFSLVSFGFVACSDDSDDDNSTLASIAAANAKTLTGTYTGTATVDDTQLTFAFSFNTDGTGSEQNTWKEGNKDAETETESFTYTISGNTISFTDADGTMSGTLSDDRATITFTNVVIEDIDLGTVVFTKQG